jgi:hypothetical protein
MPKPTASPTAGPDGEAARALEPALNCDAALLSPSTGIIDSHAICWRCAATPKMRAQPLRSTPRLLGARARGAASRSTPAAKRRCRWNAGFWSTPQASAPRGGAQHRRHADRIDSAGLSCQGQLFQLQRAGAVFASDLPGARARRPRRASHPRYGGTGAVRPRRGMGRSHRLCGRSGAGGAVLSGDPPLLADAAGRRADAELFGMRPKIVSQRLPCRIS